MQMKKDAANYDNIGNFVQYMGMRACRLIVFSDQFGYRAISLFFMQVGLSANSESFHMCK